MTENLIDDINVSRETYERLRHFEALTIKWSSKINLVSKDTLADVWRRHILDSVQLFALPQVSAGAWVDIGSGGGFPGVVAAILLAEIAPDRHVTMIESDQRKATFLRTALRECSVAGSVLAQRIEAAEPQNAATLTARALASVDSILPHVVRHLAPDGVALLHKGRNVQAELDVARKNWSFDVTAHESLTAPESSILEIRNIQRADRD